MTTTPPSLNQAIYAQIRAGKRTRSICGDYANFEHSKREWIDANVDASPAQYSAAVTRIARECGV